MRELERLDTNPDKNNYDLVMDAEDSENEQKQDNKKDNKDAANDLINYKGIYFDDESGQKFQCPTTGAHFEYVDMFRRLKKVLNNRLK